MDSKEMGSHCGGVRSLFKKTAKASAPLGKSYLPVPDQSNCLDDSILKNKRLLDHALQQNSYTRSDEECQQAVCVLINLRFD